MSLFPMNWSLETIFSSHQIPSLLEELRSELKLIEELAFDSSLEKVIKLQKIREKIAELESYAICLSSENAFCEKGPLIEADVKNILAIYHKLLLKTILEIGQLEEKKRDSLLLKAKTLDLDFFILEQLELSKKKLCYSHEATILDLEVDGYHGFSQLYHTLHSSLEFSIDDEKLSYAQLENLLHSLDKKIRDKAFKSYIHVFNKNQQLFAQILNHIGGFRLEVYKKRGWESFLFEPLFNNRMSERTLKAMLAAISANLAPFSKYLQKKASLLSLKTLDWQDIETPLFTDTDLTSYDKGCHLIINQISKYGESMGAFCKKALSSRWVEAEDRPLKSAGGFCTALSLKKESRIFMTYHGTNSNISTLAHELGHAFHNEILFSKPYFIQDVKMNLAETASTMFEIIVSEGLLSEAKTKEAKLSILDEKISRSIAFFMNITSRFLFESRFYSERKKGAVSPIQLSHIMEISQKEAYQHCLGSYNPLFWASKMHFYFTDSPFYNFPYTFGYLFSLGIFACLSKDKTSLESRYIALLSDSACYSTEALALKHLNVNLEKQEFWEMAIQEATKDIELFFELI